MNLELKIYELRVQELLNKRQMVINMLTVLLTGEIGLLFIRFSSLTLCLFILGLYYIIMLTNNYTTINNKLYKYLKIKGIQ